MTRKTISILLILAMLLACAGTSVFSDEIIQNMEETERRAESVPVLEQTPVPEATPVSEETSEVEQTPEAQKTPVTEKVSEGEAVPKPAVTPVPEESVKQEQMPVPEATPGPAPSPAPSREELEANGDKEQGDGFVKIAAAGDISSELAAGPYTISEDGDYFLSSVTTGNNIIVTAGVTATLTVDDVDIICTGQASPIKLEAGANLTLYLVGENTFEAGVDKYAGIAVCANETERATLTIEGDGTLDVSSTKNAAAIGSSASGAAYGHVQGRFGNIIINGGVVNARANGINSAGIGGGYMGGGGYIEINDGKVDACSYNGGGIGGYNTSYPAAAAGMVEVVINGGRVKAYSDNAKKAGIGAMKGAKCTVEINGGSVDAVIDTLITPVNKLNATLKKITVSMPDPTDGEDMRDKRLTEESSGMPLYTDSVGNGQVYLYLPVPDSGANVGYYAIYESEDGDITYYNNEINNSSDTYTFVRVEDAGECICSPEGNARVEVSAQIPDEISVNKIEERTTVALPPPDFYQEESCASISHTPTYTYSIDGSTSRASISSDGNFLEVIYQTGSETITLSVTATVNGKEYTATKEIVLKGDDKCRVYLSDGEITIAPINGESDFMLVTAGSTSVKVLKTETVYIEQGSGRLYGQSITIRNGVNPTINLKDININRYDYNSVLNIGDGVDLTVELDGVNYFETFGSVVSGSPAASTLTIGTAEGVEGELTCRSGEGAAIGSVSKVTINGGHIYAYGGKGVGDEEGTDIYCGAGIGGDYENPACEVEINGGRVYAIGGGNAAGIGGGGSLKGYYSNELVTINGGMVFAQSEGSGRGIGYGSGVGSTSDKPVIITGGSVKAVIGSKKPTSTGNTKDGVYLITLSLQGVSDQRDVTYSVTDGIGSSEKIIKTSTDENGKLYLYLRNITSGKRWIRVYDGANTYYYYTKIETNNNNEGEAVLAPTDKEITSFEVPGQIGDTIMGEDDTIEVEVPRGVAISSITPKVKHEKAADNRPSGALDFVYDEATDTYIGKYIVIGHDLTEREYTVIVRLNGDEIEGPTTLDISQHDILITDTYVKYGDTYYTVNPDGYVIVGETTKYSLQISSSSLANEIPPVTLDNVKIIYSGSVAPLMVNNANVNINIKGDCVLTALSGNVVILETVLEGVHLNITSENSIENVLHIHGSMTGPAVQISSPKASMTSTNVALSVISGAGQAAFNGKGAFYTDSDSYVRVTSHSTSNIVPMQKGENGGANIPLYQIAAKIDTAWTSESEHACLYDNKNYYIDEDVVLYLMVAGGEYDMHVLYGDKLYRGLVKVNATNVMTTLYTVRVDKITPDTTQLSYRGGDVTFVVDGTLVAGYVSMKYEDAEGNASEDVAVAQTEEGSNIAVLNFPINKTSTSRSYGIYYTVEDAEPVRLPTPILVKYNDTLCSIDTFELQGQVRSEFGADGVSVRVYMPFDHAFQDQERYLVSGMDITGESVSPAKNSMPIFRLQNASSSSAYQLAVFTVKAENGVDKQEYSVRVYCESGPNIQRAIFDNPTTSDGGTVTVSLAGERLGNIEHAENDENKKVLLYLDGELVGEAQRTEENGLIRYVTDVEVPANESTAGIAKHTLSAKIGDWKTFVLAQEIEVPRKTGYLCDIAKFAAENQVSAKITNVSETLGNIEVLMPYYADLNNIKIKTLEPEDTYASYQLYSITDTERSNPLSLNQNINCSNPLECVITAENGERKTYMITFSKQDKPVITRVEFTNPATSSPKTVNIKIYGENLESIEYAIDQAATITVSANLVSGEASGSEIQTATAQMSESGGYYSAVLSVPDNPDTENNREYEILAFIDAAETYAAQQHLIIPAKESDRKEITSIKLADGQGEVDITESENVGYITLEVPYNTDLRNIAPLELIYSGVSIDPPVTEKRNFSVPVTYTVTAESGSVRTYTIITNRKASAGITDVNVLKEPAYFSDTENIMLEVVGDFIPIRAEDATGPRDVLKISVECGDEKYDISTFDYDEHYGGYALSSVDIARNETFADKIYTVTVTLNRNDFSGGTITVPARPKRSITKFEVDGAAGVIDEDNRTIRLTLPYNTDLSAVEPVIETDGGISRQTSGFARTENRAEYSAQYTVSADHDEPRVYTAYITRAGQPTVSKAVVTNPDDYRGRNASVKIEGVFFDSAVVKAVAADGMEFTADVDFSEGSLTASFDNIPRNNNVEKAAEYEIYITIDGFEYSNITYEQDLENIVVPARPKRSITKFEIGDAAGAIDEDNRTIRLTLPYNTDLSAVEPVIEADGGTSRQTSGFALTKNRAEYLAQYTVTSEIDDEARTYAVYAARAGQPTVSKAVVTNPDDYRGGSAVLDIEGIFFDKMSAVAVAPDGREIAAKVTFEKGKATAKFEGIARNDSITDTAEYEIRINIDGFSGENITYEQDLGSIVVPVRPKRSITKFEIGDAAGAINEDNRTIRLTLPYNTDLSAVEPIIETDGGTSRQTSGFALTKNRAEYSAQYVVSSEIDEPRTYTVYAVRDGRPSVSSVEITNPVHYDDHTAVIEIEGIFFDHAAVTAVSADGKEIEADVTFEMGKLTARFDDIPRNESVTDAARYDIKLDIDGFNNGEITFEEELGSIVVPRRKTQELRLNLGDEIQEGETRYNGKDIIINVPYCYAEDLVSVAPNIEFYDADTIYPAEGEALDLRYVDNPVKYTLSSAGEAEDTVYTIRINFIGGDPYLESFEIENQVGETQFDGDNIQIIVPPYADLSAVEPIVSVVPEDAGYTSLEGPINISEAVKEPFEFIVKNKYGVAHKYYISVIRQEDTSSKSVSGGVSSSSKVTFRSEPTAFISSVKPYINGYMDAGVRKFGPDNNITRAEVAKILSVLDIKYENSVWYPALLSDTGVNKWYTNYMNYSILRGYISGYEDKMSRPDNDITRAEFAMVLARFLNVSASADESGHFSDLAGYDWCSKQIGALSERGIIRGYETGEFRPDDCITRAEAVTMINRAIGRKTLDKYTDEYYFEDLPQSHWAYDYIMAAACEGLKLSFE